MIGALLHARAREIGNEKGRREHSFFVPLHHHHRTSMCDRQRPLPNPGTISPPLPRQCLIRRALIAHSKTIPCRNAKRPPKSNINHSTKQMLAAPSASRRLAAEAPSSSSSSFSTSPTLFASPDPTAPFPGGGAWYEARASKRASRRCSDPAVSLVHGSDGSSRQDLVALGSLAALRAVAKAPEGGDKKSSTIEDFASKPLTLVSVDSPRLCLTAPNVAASTAEKNREEGVDVAGE